MKKMPVAVMSGAAFHQFENQFLSAFPDDAKFEHLYLFPTNAAACYQFAGGAWVATYDHSFTPAEREHVMEVLNESLKETGFDKPPSQVWGERVEDRGTQITFSALGQQAPIEEKQKWDPTRAKRRPLYDLLAGAPARVLDRSQRLYIDRHHAQRHHQSLWHPPIGEVHRHFC